MKAPDTQEETPFGALPPHFSGCHVKKRGQIPLADRTKAPTLQPQPDSSQIQPSGPLGVRPRHSGTERNCSLLVLPEGPTQNGEQKSQILASATTQGCPQLPTIELPVNAGACGGGVSLVNLAAMGVIGRRFSTHPTWSLRNHRQAEKGLSQQDHLWRRGVDWGFQRRKGNSKVRRSASPPLEGRADAEVKP